MMCCREGSDNNNEEDIPIIDESVKGRRVSMAPLFSMMDHFEKQREIVRTTQQQVEPNFNDDMLS